ncbi:hypothetical protein CHLRE_02g118550v5 [Chlamydomonas reinhardtii]|uniref:Uncharacterized protein n=1 Tax=Chlamydomonas reinhardtii TaxID=3055 RepID=A0A2K3E3M2_CHLRE|nr:uncharacterized protein CHLRE_02g118550v5 [Chlamydomonas reinhardtii]PNW87337.1 hypothetical protein CHLRE_02g118550v5 [Chlamydomonas reinhardtii]
MAFALSSRAPASFSVAAKQARRPRSAVPMSRARCVVARAELQDPVRNIQGAVQSFVRRYDLLSTGAGALLVTGWFYVHGQDPWTALSLTFTSTVVALVANELLFSSDKSQ